jgi:hypothetical protein
MPSLIPEFLDSLPTFIILTVTQKRSSFAWERIKIEKEHILLAGDTV